MLSIYHGIRVPCQTPSAYRQPSAGTKKRKVCLLGSHLLLYVIAVVGDIAVSLQAQFMEVVNQRIGMLVIVFIPFYWKNVKEIYVDFGLREVQK